MDTRPIRREVSGPLASSEEVAAAASAARAHGRIGIDTEFMSEGRYRALLCLVQIAVDDDSSDGPQISLIDPLERDVDATPIAQLLADPAIEVVLHAGRQDVAILRRAWTTEIDEHLRYAARGRVRRRERTDRIRQPAGDGARPAGRQDRELHAVGRPAAHR